MADLFWPEADKGRNSGRARRQRTIFFIEDSPSRRPELMKCNVKLGPCEVKLEKQMIRIKIFAGQHHHCACRDYNSVLLFRGGVNARAAMREEHGVLIPGLQEARLASGGCGGLRRRDSAW